jgi:hypothetical protein
MEKNKYHVYCPKGGVCLIIDKYNYVDRRKYYGSIELRFDMTDYFMDQQYYKENETIYFITSSKNILDLKPEDYINDIEYIESIIAYLLYLDPYFYSTLMKIIESNEKLKYEYMKEKLTGRINHR